MAVVTLTITDSPIQIVQGIPQTVVVNTNIPSTIFYTLDGSNPSINSNILVNPLYLPTMEGKVIFKVFATNGTDTSAIIEKNYENTTFSSLRRPYDTVQGPPNSVSGRDLFPFGTNSPKIKVKYGNTGGEVVSSPGNTNYPTGWNGKDGYAGFTDLPLMAYQNIYSETDNEGRYGKFIGTLPAKVQIRIPPPPPEESQQNSFLFNPKAMVIFQDGTKPPEDPMIARQNRTLFSLDNPAVINNGGNFYNVGPEVQGPTGSFVRSTMNPRDGTITYYYFDSQNLRWIISKEPAGAKSNPASNLSQVIRSPRKPADAKVYKWIPF